MKYFFFLFFLCTLLPAQESFEHFPASGNLASSIITRRFNCPVSLNAVKFPASFYRDAKVKSIFSIQGTKLVRSRSCFTQKEQAEEKQLSASSCEWTRALMYIPLQCDKWSRGGENGVSPQFRKRFYERMAAAFPKDTFYIPDLTFHFFYLKKDSVPQLVVYEHSTATDTRQYWFSINGDSIRKVKEISGYTLEARPNPGKLILINRLEEGISDSLRARMIYAVSYQNGKLAIADSLLLVSKTGLQLTNYTIDRKFCLQQDAKVYNAADLKSDPIAEIKKGSWGYVLAENNKSYFAVVLNNVFFPFKEEVNPSYVNSVRCCYTLCWIPKNVVDF